MPTTTGRYRKCDRCQCTDVAVCLQIGCRCDWPLCFERAVIWLSRGASRQKRLRCDRHMRADLVTAERFGQAVVAEGLPQRQPVLALDEP